MSDDRLRTALLELADVAPPPDLAGAALTRARRDRRRAAAGLLVAVALLVAGAITVPALALGRPAATRPPAAPAGPSGLLITGYSTVADPTNGKIPDVSNGPSVFNPPGGAPAPYSRARGRYVPVPWQIAQPSPDGRLLVVSTAGVKNGASVNGRIGILAADRVDDPNAVRWIPGAVTDGWIGWASDSKRVFYRGDLSAAPDPAAVRGLSFHVVDVGTLADHPATLPVPEGDLLIGSMPVVPTGGPAYALALDYRGPGSNGAPARLTVRYYDDHGVRIRDVTAVGVGRFPTQVAEPFSPNGRLVALDAGDASDIVDTSTGRVVRPHIDGVFMRWFDDTRIIVAAGRSVRVVEVATGRVVAQKVVAPVGQRLVNVWLAPLFGPRPPGSVTL